jgi:LysM repeat protein
MKLKKYIVYILVAVLIDSVDAFAGVQQMKWSSQYQTYINMYKDIAIEEMLHYHIPASITLAQGLLESRAGLSDLTLQSNNHFGIKCNGGWTGPTSYHDDDAESECFRAYPSAYESYEDHSKFLSSKPRYASLFALDLKDYRGWAYGLKAAGYATSPTYAEKLIGIIELYKLYQFDSARKYDHFIANKISKERPSVSGEAIHPIYRYNDNYYLVARKGDTFRSIADEVDIPYRALARYNERDYDDELAKNDIVYLKKKRRKADKSFKNRPHYVKAGESMYTISQFYGIRLKYLYKMNHLDANYQIRVGDELRVR